MPFEKQTSLPLPEQYPDMQAQIRKRRIGIVGGLALLGASSSELPPDPLTDQPQVLPHTTAESFRFTDSETASDIKVSHSKLWQRIETERTHPERVLWISQAAAEDPRYFLKHFPQLQKENNFPPTLINEWLTSAARYTPLEVVHFLQKENNNPSVRTPGLTAAILDATEFLLSPDNPSNQPGGNGSTVLNQAYMLDQDYEEAIQSNITFNAAGIVESLQELNQLDGGRAQNIARTTVEILKEDPQYAGLIIKEYPQIKEILPEHEIILAKTLQRASRSGQTELVLEAYPYYAHLPRASALLHQNLTSLIWQKYYFPILELVEKYQDAPQEVWGPLLEEAVEKTFDTALLPTESSYYNRALPALTKVYLENPDLFPHARENIQTLVASGIEQEAFARLNDPNHKTSNGLIRDTFLSYFKPYFQQFQSTDIFDRLVRENPWDMYEEVEILLGKGAFRNGEIISQEEKVALKKLFDDTEKNAMIGETGIGSWLEAAVQPTDFPLDPERFRLMLRGVNRLNETQTLDEDEFGVPLISTRRTDFEHLFLSTGFQKALQYHSGKLSYANAFSLAQAVFREITENPSTALDTHRIETTARFLLQMWEEKRDLEIIGPETHVILMIHEEKIFDPDTTFGQLFKKTQPKHISTYQGVALDEQGHNTKKSALLKTLRESNGPTTFIFNGHGSPEFWAFTENQSDNMKRDIKPGEDGLTYKELAEALADSPALENMNIIGSTCHAYNFFRNVLAELARYGKGQPRLLISTANRERLAFIEDNIRLFSKVLTDTLKNDQHLRLDHFFRAEGQMPVRRNDLGFIIPRPDTPDTSPAQPKKKTAASKPRLKRNYLELGMHIDGEPTERTV